MPLILAVTPLPTIYVSPRFVFAVCGNLQSSVLNGTQAEDNDYVRVTGEQNGGNTNFGSSTKAESTDKHFELSCPAGAFADTATREWSTIDHSGGRR